jgi:hypothetical protein
MFNSLLTCILSLFLRLFVEAIKKLHEAKELNDNLVIAKDGVAKNGELNNEKIVNADSAPEIEVKVKLVPDVLYCHRAPAGGTELHFYDVNGPDDGRENMLPVAGCNDCEAGLDVLSKVGLAFREKISNDILSTAFSLHFGKEAWKEYQLRYLGSAILTREQLCSINFFHSSAFLGERMLSSATSSFIDVRSVHSPSWEHIRAKEENHPAMYVIPLPFRKDDGRRTVAVDILQSPREYTPFVEVCAMEAQVMMHNIAVVRSTQSGTGTRLNVK